MATKRNNSLCIIRKIFGTNVEIHLTEDEVCMLYDEVCRRSRDRHLGTEKFPKMPNEYEVCR